MGRTRQHGTARDRLLAAADDLFYSCGVSATGVDAVVAHADVAIGSLYNNFGGKDALIAAYLEARDQRWRDHWESCIAEQSDPVARVLALFTALQRWTDGLLVNRGCAHVTAALQLEPGSPGRDKAIEHKHHLLKRLRQLIAATGVADPADVAHDVLIVYEGVFSLLALELDHHAIERARRLCAARLRQAVSE